MGHRGGETPNEVLAINWSKQKPGLPLARTGVTRRDPRSCGYELMRMGDTNLNKILNRQDRPTLQAEQADPRSCKGIR